MWHIFSAARSVFCLLKIQHVVILAFATFTAVQPGQSAAQPPAVTLTQIGSPIWRPVDFQLFSAPVEADGVATVGRALEPLAPLGPGEPYTTPHGPPYETELSTNAAAAGFVNRSVFPREAIMGDPNRIVFAHMLLPDPGITGSSRDFASGPVIPHSLFPLTGDSEWWNDGALGFDPGPFLISVRPSDQPFDGSSHRLPISTHWNRGADNLGNYEFRQTFRDAQGNGWDIVAPFRIVAELPPGDFNQDGTVDAADYIVWRKTDGTQTGYDAWRTNFGTSLNAGSGSVLPSTESLSAAVPEPAAIMLLIAGVLLRATRLERKSASLALKSSAVCQSMQLIQAACPIRIYE